MEEIATSSGIAWDITEWDGEADLGLLNMRQNLYDTFMKAGLMPPTSIICRQDQKYQLIKAFGVPPYDETPFHMIDIGFGRMKVKVLL